MNKLAIEIHSEQIMAIIRDLCYQRGHIPLVTIAPLKHGYEVAEFASNLDEDKFFDNVNEFCDMKEHDHAFIVHPSEMYKDGTSVFLNHEGDDTPDSDISEQCIVMSYHQLNNDDDEKDSCLRIWACTCDHNLDMGFWEEFDVNTLRLLKEKSKGD